MTEKKTSSDKEIAKRKLIKFLLGMGLNNIFAWGVGIYLICIKHPFSFIIIVGSILELVFIIYYFGKEWIRLTKDD